MPRITDYELYEVPPRWVFLRIETSDGRVGWGEPVVEGRAHTEESDVLDYLADPAVFEYDEGCIDLPERPGLGIEIDEEVVEARADEGDWHNPVWRHDDGSVAEW